MQRKILFLILCIFPLHVVCAQSNRLIQGHVIKTENQLPISNVNIQVIANKIGTTTDSTGYFKIIAPHYFIKLYISHIGYAKQTIEIPAARNDTTIIIKLSQQPIDAPELSVQARRIADLPAEVSIAHRELQVMPGFTAETMDAIKTLPFVASNNELSNKISVQAGSPDDNGYFIDGIEIDQPQLVRNSYQENLSPINPMLVEQLHFSAGTYPAQYGDYLSSLLLTSYRKRLDRRYRVQSVVGTMFSAGALEWQVNDKFYAALGIRQAYQNRVIEGAFNVEGKFVPSASDFQLNLNYDFSESTKLQWLSVFNKNKYNSTPELKTTYYFDGQKVHKGVSAYFQGIDNFNREWFLSALKLNHKPMHRLSVQHMLGWKSNHEHENINLSTYKVGDGPFIEIPGRRTSAHISRIVHSQQSDKLDIPTAFYQMNNAFIVSRKLLTKFGFAYQQQKYDGTLSEFRVDSLLQSEPATYSQRPTLSKVSIDQRKFTVYASIWWQLAEPLELNGGARFMHFENNTYVMPRIDLQFKPNQRNLIYFSAGKYAQLPTYNQMRTVSGEFYPDLSPQQSTNFTMGWRHKTSANAEKQVQLFHKKINHFIPYLYDDASIIYQPELDASATVYGGSFFWRGNIIPEMQNWLTYTYLIGRETIAGEGKSRLPYDQRHTATIFLQDQHPRFLGMKAHLRILFGSGYAYTKIERLIEEESQTFTYQFGERNAYRLPYYRRADIGLSYEKHFTEGRQLIFSIDIHNFYDMKNALGYGGMLQNGLFQGNSGFTEDDRINLSRQLFNARIAVTY